MNLALKIDTENQQKIAIKIEIAAYFTNLSFRSFTFGNVFEKKLTLGSNMANFTFVISELRFLK